MNNPNIKNTGDQETSFLKVLVHGPSGSGKTRLCATTGGKPLIISAEAGLLSIKDAGLDFWEINNMDDMAEVFEFLKNDKVYDWVCLDSISEVAEVLLSHEKKLNKDARKAYMEMGEQMSSMIRSFRDLPKNIYMSAKQDKIKDDVTGGLFYGPSTPGQKTASSLPYFFDEVFALQSWKDEEGKIQSALQTQRDNQYEAKDRSGKLDFVEQPNLEAIRAKIINPLKGE
jgi:hypothetical protein